MCHHCKLLWLGSAKACPCQLPLLGIRFSTTPTTSSYSFLLWVSLLHLSDIPTPSSTQVHTPYLCSGYHLDNSFDLLNFPWSLHALDTLYDALPHLSRSSCSEVSVRMPSSSRTHRLTSLYTLCPPWPCISIPWLFLLALPGAWLDTLEGIIVPTPLQCSMIIHSILPCLMEYLTASMKKAEDYK